jgi:hypothetical protein
MFDTSHLPSFAGCAPLTLAPPECGISRLRSKTMAIDELRFRISYRALLVLLLLTVIPISVAGLYTISQSGRTLESVIGTYFRTIAQSAAGEISLLVHHGVEQAATFASGAAVRDAVISANRTYAGQSPEAIQARARRIEDQWNKPEGARIPAEILATPASNQLRRFRELNPRFLRITVTDAEGGVAAMTHKTLDYWQADEEFWENIHASGRGAVSLTDILYDEVTKAHYIGIGVPIVDPASGAFIGALDALMDVAGLQVAINRVQIGNTGRALLVKEDGTVIGGRGVNLGMNVKSEEFEALRDAVPNLLSQPFGQATVNLRNGRSLIGYADTGLKNDYRTVSGIVLVSQSDEEAFAPARRVERLLAVMALLGLLSATVLIAYFSLHRQVRFTDLEAAATAREES